MRLMVWFGAVCALGLAGCSCSGDDATGAPCNGSDEECPTGQMCMGGFCRAPGSGADGSGLSGLECQGPNCATDAVGIGGNRPFMPDPTNSNGVGLDDDGALVLDSGSLRADFIWIANTGGGSVSRFETRPPFREVGRFMTGPDGANSEPSECGDVCSGNDPSRTSVNTSGDVYVANRQGNTVARISVLGTGCPDQNGDGNVSTSTNSDVLPWGEDECVLWSRDLSADFPGETRLRAVAAQDVEGPDGELREYVWVGGWSSGRIAKLDGRTGEVLFAIQSPVRPYGFALDRRQNLWISTTDDVPNTDSQARAIGRVQTAACDANSCESESIPAQHAPYGITVDFRQRVWAAGRGGIGRYDIEQGTWDLIPQRNGITRTHGIAADGEGWVWVAGGTPGMFRIDGETLEWTRVSGTEGTGLLHKGVAVDGDGKIWSIPRSNSGAFVITPGATLEEATVERDIASTGLWRYTYSDMTGLQLRLATNSGGTYREVFEGCPEGDLTTWTILAWEAELPPRTRVSFQVRTANTQDELNQAQTVFVASDPPDRSPIQLSEVLAAEGVVPGRFLLVEVRLEADRESTTEVISPRVRSFGVANSCPVGELL